MKRISLGLVIFVFTSAAVILSFQNCSEQKLSVGAQTGNSNNANSSSTTGRLPSPVASDLTAYSVTEGQSFTVTLALPAAATSAVNLHWQVETAMMNQIIVDDFVAATGTISISAGQLSIPFTIQTKNNAVITANKNYRLKIFADGNYDPLYADVIIKDDDGGQLFAAHHFACLLKSEKLWCWGYNAWGAVGNARQDGLIVPVATPVSGMASGVQGVATGTNNTCAIRSGQLFCWGYNGYGQLGRNTADGVVNASPLAVNNMETGVTQVSLGYYTACAIKNGGLFCWGYNGYGQIGDGTTVNRYVPTAVSGMSSGVTAVSNSKNGDDPGLFNHTCAIKDGALYCWGNNANGQLGNGINVNGVSGSFNTYVPQMVIGMESGVTAVSAGSYSTCAVKNQNIYCWGYSGNGEIGGGDAYSKFAPVKVGGALAGKKIVSVDQTKQGFCAKTDIGGLYCWGYNNHGQLGSGNTNNQLLPNLIVGFDKDVTSYAGAGYSSYAVLNNRVFSWGWNANGQLGIGISADANTVAPTTPIIDLNTLQ